MQETPKRLARSDNRLIAGVCAGIADYFVLDPTLVRIGFLLLTLLSAAFPGILIYLICWIVMPEKND